MNCTLYDEAVPYNLPIAYNGVCVTPPVPGGGGGPFGGFVPTPFVAYPKREDEEEVVALILAEILVDED